jgi:hypothetical protein
MGECFWTADLDWRFDGVPLLVSAAATPEAALAALAAAPLREGAEWLRERGDEVGVRKVRFGGGYVLACGDDLWQEGRGYLGGADPRLEAAWGAPAADPGGAAVWVAEGYTESHFRLQGWGRTPEEALAGLQRTWEDEYAPIAGADPGYLAEIAEEIKLHEVPFGGSVAVDPTRPIPTAAEPRFAGILGGGGGGPRP